jgi:transposase
MTSRRLYRSDLSDARWALIEPILTEWRAARVARGLGINEPVRELREIVNGILYVNRTGIGWDYLPHDLPPRSTVYWYFSEWERDGTGEKIHDVLRKWVRKAAGRAVEPTAALVDAQSIRTSSNVPETSQGIDAGKKIKGRKRHIVTDTLGLLLVVMVTAASVQDTTGGRTVIDTLASRYPSVVKAWVDAGYKRSVVERGAAHGIDVEVVSKEPGQKGFKPLPKRWAVERTFGWLVLHRRLVRDYETLPKRSIAMIHWAMIDNMSRRLTGESTPTWRNDPPTDTSIPGIAA